MLLRTRPQKRRAVTAVECAIILPITIFLTLFLVVGSLGVFRYLEVAACAREGARYASTHGQMSREHRGLSTGTKEEWEQDIYENGVRPNLVALNPDEVECTCNWPDVINQPGKPDNWPGSKVEVTVRYKWMPEFFLVGPIYLESTSSMPITN